MTLGGGVNLTREPRNGRTFEYAGEDPLLAGIMVGNMMKCEQAEHVVGDMKHYVLNDQETGRNVVNAIISKRALQETDLLAFHIGIRLRIRARSCAPTTESTATTRARTPTPCTTF